MRYQSFITAISFIVALLICAAAPTRAETSKEKRVTTSGVLQTSSIPAEDGQAYRLVDNRGSTIYYVVGGSESMLAQAAGKKVRLSGRLENRHGYHIPFLNLGERNSETRPFAADIESAAAIGDSIHVRPASHSVLQQPEVIDGPTVGPGELILHPQDDYFVGDESGDVFSDWAPPTRRRQADWLWVRGDYLLWWTDGMDVPPLVTTSPPTTPAANQGVLGVPGTEILFGNEEILDQVRSGGRLRFGTWLDCNECWGIEGEFFGFDEIREHFRRNCFDNPVLARPFFNVNPMLPGGPQQDAQQVCSPGNLHGAVTVDASSSLWSAGVRVLANQCRLSGCGVAPRSGRPFHWSTRRDFLIGYRFMRLNEDLSIREELSGPVRDPMGNIIDVVNFDLLDMFETSTEFHGVDLGWQWQWRRNRLSLELLTKVALGNNRQVVNISGRTFTSDAGGVSMHSGGLLTQPSNIGEYTQDRFSVVPELGVTLGYDITQNLRFMFGYTFIYWTDVVRPGDQIDLSVNDLFLDPMNRPVPDPQRPAFNFVETDYWAQGLSFGFQLDL